MAGLDFFDFCLPGRPAGRENPDHVGVPQSLLFYTFLQMTKFSHLLQCTFVLFIRIILFFDEFGCHLVVTESTR